MRRHRDLAIMFVMAVVLTVLASEVVLRRQREQRSSAAASTHCEPTLHEQLAAR